MKTILFYIIALWVMLSCSKTSEISEQQAEKFLKYFGTSGADVAGGIVSADGGYIMLGSEWSTEGQRTVLYKTDRFGNKEWQKNISDSLDLTANAFTPVADGGYLICGNYNDGFGYSDIFVSKIASDYSVSWVKHFGGKYDENAQAIAADSDGNIYLTGIVSSDPKQNAESTDILLMKLSAAGDSLWAKKIGASKADNGAGICIHPEGRVYVVGSSVSYKEMGQDRSNVILIESTLDGNVIDRATFGGIGDDYGYGITISPDGALYLSGTVENAEKGADAWLAKISVNIHAPEWEQLTAYFSNNHVFSIAEENGVLLAAGYTRAEGTKKNVYVLKYSTAGEKLAEIATQSEGDEYAYSVSFADDGNPVFVGVTEFESNAMLFMQKTKF